MVVASEDSDEIAVVEVEEMIVERVVEHVVLEWACWGVAIASVALVDKLVAFEDVAVEVVDVEVGAVEGVGCIETVEVVVDLVVDAFATQLLFVDCRSEDSAYKHS